MLYLTIVRFQNMKSPQDFGMRLDLYQIPSTALGVKLQMKNKKMDG